MPSLSATFSASSASISSPSYSAALLKPNPGSLIMSQNLPLRSSSTTSPSFIRSTSTFTGFSPKLYLTLHNLYIRYVPLKSLTSASFRVSTPKILPRMTLKDLFNKFDSKFFKKPILKSHATLRRPSNPPLPAKPLSQSPLNPLPAKSLRKRAVKREEFTQNCIAPQASPLP